jgi:hypothetical protein
MVGSWNVGGQLTIWPSGLVEVRLSKLMGRLVGIDRFVHAQPSITVLMPRIAFPWMSTSVVLDGGYSCAVAVAPRWHRKRLLAALRNSGLTVSVRRTWIGIGWLLAT